MTYVVIENTPGYMPDDDDPFVTDDLAAAREYAARLARDCADALYGYEDERECDVTITRTSDDSWEIMSNRPHDLGRVVEVMPLEG